MGDETLEDLENSVLSLCQDDDNMEELTLNASDEDYHELLNDVMSLCDSGRVSKDTDPKYHGLAAWLKTTYKIHIHTNGVHCVPHCNYDEDTDNPDCIHSGMPEENYSVVTPMVNSEAVQCAERDTVDIMKLDFIPGREFTPFNNGHAAIHFATDSRVTTVSQQTVPLVQNTNVACTATRCTEERHCCNDGIAGKLSVDTGIPLPKAVQHTFVAQLNTDCDEKAAGLSIPGIKSSNVAIIFPLLNVSEGMVANEQSSQNQCSTTTNLAPKSKYPVELNASLFNKYADARMLHQQRSEDNSADPKNSSPSSAHEQKAPLTDIRTVPECARRIEIVSDHENDHPPSEFLPSDHMKACGSDSVTTVVDSRVNSNFPSCEKQITSIMSSVPNSSTINGDMSSNAGTDSLSCLSNYVFEASTSSKQKNLDVATEGIAPDLFTAKSKPHGDNEQPIETCFSASETKIGVGHVKISANTAITKTELKDGSIKRFEEKQCKWTDEQCVDGKLKLSNVNAAAILNMLPVSCASFDSREKVNSEEVCDSMLKSNCTVGNIVSEHSDKETLLTADRVLDKMPMAKEHVTPSVLPTLDNHIIAKTVLSVSNVGKSSSNIEKKLLNALIDKTGNELLNNSNINSFVAGTEQNFCEVVDDSIIKENNDFEHSTNTKSCIDNFELEADGKTEFDVGRADGPENAINKDLNLNVILKPSVSSTSSSSGNNFNSMTKEDENLLDETVEGKVQKISVLVSRNTSTQYPFDVQSTVENVFYSSQKPFDTSELASKVVWPLTFDESHTTTLGPSTHCTASSNSSLNTGSDFLCMPPGSRHVDTKSLLPLPPPSTSVAQFSNGVSIDPQPFTSTVSLPDLPDKSVAIPVAASVSVQATSKLDFVSDDPNENNDNCNPNWDMFRMLETDDERYRAVRKRWKNILIPDPCVDLTSQTFRQHRILTPRSGNRENTFLPVNRKRPASDNNLQSQAKRFKREVSVTEKFDCQLDILDEELENNKRKLVEMYERDRSSLLDAVEHLKHMSRSCNGSNFRLYEHRRQNVNHHLDNLEHSHKRKLSDVDNEFKKARKKLKTARHEVLMFHAFYANLKNSANVNEDTTKVNRSVQEEMYECDNMYQLYSQYYR